MPTTYGILIKNNVNYSHDTSESITFDNTNTSLSSTNVQDAIEELINMIPVGSGGHTIKNDSGTSLAQKDNLQFKGVYTQNNGDNTEVDICRTMTKEQMEALSGEALKGFINTSDEPDSLPLTAEWVEYETGVSVKEALDNKVSKSGDTMTGGLIINRQNANSELELGNSTNSRGVIILFSNNDKYSVLRAPTDATSTCNIYLPDKAGTLAINPTKTQFTPTYGASVTFADRNFFVTDNVTFLDIHFCLYCGTAISANVDLIALPSIAQDKTVQYGVGVESSNKKAHLVYNYGKYLYLDEAALTADANGVFAGTFRMSLV